MKKHIWKGIVCVVVLAFAAGWVILWNRFGNTMEQADYDAQFASFTHGDAIYARCTAEVVSGYLSDGGNTLTPADSCGEADFTVNGVTVHCPIYSVRELQSATRSDALVLVERDGGYESYELVGFTSLADAPTAKEVMETYGAASSADLRAVKIYEADGTLIDTMDDAEDLETFYQQILNLGEDVGAEGQALAYYGAYIEAYGETDAISVSGGEVITADNETYEKALTLWSEGMCLVTIVFENGLQLRNTVYAPKPGIFQLYGYYAMTEPIFQ